MKRYKICLFSRKKIKTTNNYTVLTFKYIINIMTKYNEITTTGSGYIRNIPIFTKIVFLFIFRYVPK